jgi:putative sigma-54 modulation protein
MTIARTPFPLVASLKRVKAAVTILTWVGARDSLAERCTGLGSTAPRPHPRSFHVQIKIAARHGYLSDAAQQVIRDKAQKLTHFFERLTMIEITVDLKDEIKIAEFLVQAEHKHDFVARESNGEIQVAVDLALDKVIHQLRRYKEKIQDHRRTPHIGDTSAAARMPEEPA